jgi:hypothetical protein
VEDAIQQVRKIRSLSEQVSQFPGLSEGRLDDLYHRTIRFMNTYTEMSRRQYRAFKRDLDDLASRVSELFKDGMLSKKHLRILDKTLNKLKVRDFYSARRLIHRFDDVIAIKEELEESREEYRRSYQELENEIKRLRIKLEKERKVPRPEMSPDEIKAITDLLKDSKAKTKRLLSDYMSVHPSREVIETLLWGSSITHLRIPSPENTGSAEGMVRMLNSHKESRKAFGDKSLHLLIEAADYTEARFAHIMAEYLDFRRMLMDNISWLRGLSKAGGYFPNLSLDDEPDEVSKQINAWLELLNRIPKSKEAIECLTSLSEIISSSRYSTAQKNARIYNEFGDMARLSYEGKIDRLIEETESGIAERVRDLERLPEPDDVLEY